MTSETLETPIKSAQPSGDGALLFRTVALPHSRVPRGIVRHVSRELDHRTRGGRPVNERRAVRADDALRELRDDRVGKFRLASLPDVRPAIR